MHATQNLADSAERFRLYSTVDAFVFTQHEMNSKTSENNF